MLRSEIDLNIYIFMSNLVNAPVFVCFFFFSGTRKSESHLHLTGSHLSYFAVVNPCFRLVLQKNEIKEC